MFLASSWFLSGSNSLAVGPEQMDQRQVGLHMQRVARPAGDTFAEGSDEGGVGNPQRDLRLRPGWLDDHDLRGNAVLGDEQVLGPDAIGRDPGCGRARRQWQQGATLRAEAAI